MSEFFLELFSEEIPAGLQINLREKILDDFKSLFDEKSIKSKKNLLIVLIQHYSLKISYFFFNLNDIT